MKNRIYAAICIAAVLAFTGCGNSAGTSSSGASAAESAESGSSSAASADSDAVTSDDAPVTDEEFTGENADDFISLAEYKNLKINAAEGTAIADGMVANIDYVGSIDGVEFDGGTGTDYDLEIGSDTFIDGFEDQLIGHKEGDEVEVKVTFPEDYASTDLAGKDATFAVTINKVYYQSPQTAFNSVVDGSTVLKYPQGMIDSWADAYIASYNSYVSSQSTESSTLSEVSTTAELAEAYGTTEDELTTAFKTNVKGSMAAQAIMAKEGVTRESEEYTSALSDLLQQNGYSSTEEALSAGANEQQIEYLGDVLAAENILVKYEAEG